MKKLLAIGALTPGLASAHGMGAAHLHPHPDPALLAAGVAVIGAAVIVALMRRGNR